MIIIIIINIIIPIIIILSITNIICIAIIIIISFIIIIIMICIIIVTRIKHTKMAHRCMCLSVSDCTGGSRRVGVSTRCALSRVWLAYST